jgi:hypothetical protein
MSVPNDDFVIGGVTLKDGEVYGTVTHTGDPTIPDVFTVANGLSANDSVPDTFYKLDVIIAGMASSRTGTPTLGTFTVENGLDAAESVADSCWRLDQRVALLLPARPPDLSTITISLTVPVYSAIRAITPFDTVSNVIDFLAGNPPTLTSDYFAEASSGTLEAFAKTSSLPEASVGTISLTTGSDVGINGQLEITNDEDPYFSPDDGFYVALKARVNGGIVMTPSNVDEYHYKLEHSTTGSTQVNFYLDNSSSLPTPTVTGESIIAYPGTTSNVSGVPNFNSGDGITVQFTVNDTIGKFYRSSGTGSAGGSEYSTVYGTPTGADRNEGSSPTYTLIPIIQSGGYTNNSSIVTYGINANGDSSLPVNITPAGAQLRIDTLSIGMNESTTRYNSGIGQFPAVGYGGVFDPAITLVGTEELQLEGGQYKYSTLINYSTGYMPSGPDYSVIAPGSFSNMRWGTFGFVISAVSNVTITFGNTSGFDGITMTNFNLYIKVEGSTGWIDGNAAYPGVGLPIADGDPALVAGSSTNTQKSITFGIGVYTGTLYVRIGIPAGNSRRFSTITVT